MRVLIDETIEVDASVTERHSAAVELTKHPIEAGASPTDHARVMPDRLQLEALFTDTPVGQPRREGYAVEQYKRLLELKDARRGVTVRTAVRTYTAMMLTACDLPRDYRQGDAVRVSLTFEQVRFVASQRVRLTATARPSSVPKKPQEKVGQSKQVGTPATQRRSFLKSLGDSFGVTTPGAGVLQ